MLLLFSLCQVHVTVVSGNDRLNSPVEAKNEREANRSYSSCITIITEDMQDVREVAQYTPRYAKASCRYVEQFGKQPQKH